MSAWDRGLYEDETVEQTVERWEKTHPPKRPNGKAPIISLQSGAQLDASAPALEPFPWIDMSAWDEEPTPERKWAVFDRIPLRQVALFSGDGAVGKSTVELQLAAAHALGKDWLNSMPEPGGAFYLNAGEDDENELHIRLAHIIAHYGATYADLIAGGFRMIQCGDDAVLGAPNRNGIIEPTKLYRRLYEQAGDLKPKHIGIDTSADVFAGSEIDRAQVRQFVGLLRKLARVCDGSVILLSHPSLTGMSSGSGISGSTAWHNSVRARFYMTSPKSENGEQPETDLRELIFKKNQYGQPSATLVLQYQRGLYLPVKGLSNLDQAALEMNAEDVFLTLLRKLTERGIDPSPAPTSHAYAPTLMIQEPEAKGLRKDPLKAAMSRLLDRDRIHLKEVGRTGREKKVIRVGSKMVGEGG